MTKKTDEEILLELFERNREMKELAKQLDQNHYFDVERTMQEVKEAIEQHLHELMWEQYREEHKFA